MQRTLTKVYVIGLLASALSLMGVGLSAMGPADATTAGGVYLVPPTIDPTGITDVSAQLEGFFASVPDNSTITFPAYATYQINGSLKVQDRHGLTFDGNDARFVAKTPGDRNRRHFWFIRGSGIVVRNLTVVGANPNGGTSDVAYDATKEAQHAFEFDGVAGGELDHVASSDVYGDFVYVGMDLGSKTWSANIWIHDSDFQRNGRQGISVTAGRNVTIERNSLAAIRRATFDLEPNGADWGATQVTIRNNTIGSGRLLFLAAAGAAGHVDDITVTSNSLVGHAMNITATAPSGSRRYRFTVTNNTSGVPFGSPAALMTFTRVSGVEVSGNHQLMQAGRNMVGVRAYEGCDVAVHDNDFPNAATQSVVEPYSGCGTGVSSGPSTGSIAAR